MYQLRITGNNEKVQARFIVEVLGCPSQKSCSNAYALVIWKNHEAANPPILVFVLGTPNRDECHGFAVVERHVMFVGG
jgi:hypothetical protein